MTMDMDHMMREMGHMTREMGHMMREMGHMTREMGHMTRTSLRVAYQSSEEEGKSRMNSRKLPAAPVVDEIRVISCLAPRGEGSSSSSSSQAGRRNTET
ncbi:unnamed protein product [Arctogadus glacialis]